MSRRTIMTRISCDHPHCSDFIHVEDTSEAMRFGWALGCYDRQAGGPPCPNRYDYCPDHKKEHEG